MILLLTSLSTTITRVISCLVGFMCLCLSQTSLPIGAEPIPLRTVVDSIPSAKSASLLTVTVQVVNAETDTVVIGAHLSAADEKSGQSYAVTTDQTGFGVVAPRGTRLLIKASAPAYVAVQTRLPALMQSQRMVMKLMHTRPSVLTIKAFATDISQLLSPATATITSQLTGRSEQVDLQNGRIERRFTQPGKLTIQVSSPGYTSVSREMVIEVPPLGNRYEFDASLEKKSIERTVVAVNDPIRKIMTQATSAPNRLARTIQPVAFPPLIVRPEVKVTNPVTGPATSPGTKSQPFGIMEKGRRIQLNAIYFDQSSPVLRPESHTELDQLYEALQQNPALQIELRGHTDNQGDLDLNTQLSRDRCQAVVDYLTRKGIAKTRLKAVGRGPLDPITPNNTEENRRKNRRVEFVVL